MLLEKLPRISLAYLPTPLDDMTHLSKVLGGPRILIKRDDLTGLALGGNKLRKLEYLLAEAQEKGADIIITSGSSQTNHGVQTAAAAGKLGMKTILVLLKGMHPETQGNLLLANLIGADIIAIENGDHVNETIEKLANDLRKKGHKPYIVPVGGTSPLGAVGYVNAVKEICQQLDEKRITANYIFASAGTQGTMTGLSVGAKYFRAPFKVIGISNRLNKEELANNIAKLSNETAKLLEMDLTFSPSEITIYDEYVGGGYGIPTSQGIAAIRLVAQTEGIILDPVYTGKVMSGIIDLSRKGILTSEDTVIFVHTGGTGAIFAYAEELLAESG